MSSHSPRRSGSNNKKPRGGGSYHYRPKNKNGSSGNGGQGNKSGNSKHRDKQHGVDGGPSDDGGAESDERHPSSYSKPRSRYDRYDRFGSSSPRQSPTFSGQRPGGRRGNGGNSDRQISRDNRRGNNRSKFSGRGSYDDDDDEETFGRRQGRNQHKRNNDRNSYGRDYGRDQGRDRDARRGLSPRRETGDDYASGGRERRYGGYNDNNERSHYRPQRSHNPHRTTTPALDDLINIFRRSPTDEDDEAMEEELILPPTGLSEDGQHIYPIKYLMSLRKKPQHQLYSGPVLPDSVNRNLNPTPPPTENDGMGVFGRHKEPAVPTRRTEAPERSWRKSPNVVPLRQRDEPPKNDLAGAGSGNNSGTAASGDDGTRPWKPPLHHGSAPKTFEEAEAVARARETSEEEIDLSGTQQGAQSPQQSSQKQRANESNSSMSRSQSKSKSKSQKNQPEWDSATAPQDLWGSDFRFQQLDRQRDLKSLQVTGRLLDANDVVIGGNEEDGGEADDEDGGNDGRDVVFDDRRREKRERSKNAGGQQLRPVPVSAMDSAALETQIGRGQLDEDEVSDEEILRKQIEEMNFDDDDEEYANVAENYTPMKGFGKDDPDLSTIENNPWQKGDSGNPAAMGVPPSSKSNYSKPTEAVDLDLDALMREFNFDKPGAENGAKASGSAISKPDASATVPEQQRRGPSQQQPPKVASIVVPQQVRAEMSSSPQKAVNKTDAGGGGRRTADGERTPGEVTVSSAAATSGSMQQHQVPTEEQFQLYENKVRNYYYQAVMFHQKYKKYQKLYTHAHEVMVADPLQRDPLMDKYIEKYQQHRQRFQIVYEKYRRYQAYLEHFGRKVQMPTYPRYPNEYAQAPGGDPRQQYPYQYRQTNGDPRYDYEDPRHGGYSHGPDPRYANHGASGDPSTSGYGPYQQPYYPAENRVPRGYPEDYGHGPDPRSVHGRYGSQQISGHGHGHGHAPAAAHANAPRASGDEYYSRGAPPSGTAAAAPTQSQYAQRPQVVQPVVPHVKGSSALKIEKPPGRASPQPSMEDDTKTTPPGSSGAKGEASGDATSPATNGSPNDKDKGGVNDGRHGEDGNNSGEFNEPREYRAHGYSYSGHRGGRGDGIDLGLGDLGYTSAPLNRGPAADRGRRDPAAGGQIGGYPGRGVAHDGMDRSDMERQQAMQHADDYVKYYSRSSGGGMTRGEYEEYQETKRRHYLSHYRRYGHYPGAGPAQHQSGGYPMPSGAGGRGPSARMDVTSPPMRQPSPGNPNDPYYTAYAPQYNADQDQYYQRASPAMMQGDYPHYYARGHSKPEDY